MKGAALALGAIFQLTGDGAWTWFNDPRAIYDDGKIITGWVTRSGDIEFASHNLTTHDTTILPLDRGFDADDHVNPSFLKNPDGTITAFYAPHGGPDVRSVKITRGTNNFCTADRPTLVPRTNEDPPGSWGWSYTNPFYLSHERRLYLASRGPNFNPVIRVCENGAWGSAKHFILNQNERPYVKYDSNGLDRISFAFTDAHPLGHRNNIYFASYRDGVYWRPNGTKIRSITDGPLTMEDAQAAIVYTGDNSWIWDVATDSSGHPIAVFASFPTTDAHRYHWSRWDGSQWLDRVLVDNAGGSIAPATDEFHYSGGIAVDHTNPNIVYLSRQTAPEQWDLEQWKTRDNGETWSHLTIASAKGVKNIRPFVPLGRPAHTEMVLWMSGAYGYWDFTRNGGYRTAIHLWTCPTK
jgi:hypothetical protein